MNNGDFVKEFGKRIERERKRQGWSMRELSRQSRVSLSQIHRIENGWSKCPIEQCLRLCDALGVEFSSFVSIILHDLKADGDSSDYVYGVCTECGCTDEDPCVDEATGYACSWMNEAHTICSACCPEGCEGRNG